MPDNLVVFIFEFCFNDPNKSFAFSSFHLSLSLRFWYPRALSHFLPPSPCPRLTRYLFLYIIGTYYMYIIAILASPVIISFPHVWISTGKSRKDILYPSGMIVCMYVHFTHSCRQTSSVLMVLVSVVSLKFLGSWFDNKILVYIILGFNCLSWSNTYQNI